MDCGVVRRVIALFIYLFISPSPLLAPLAAATVPLARAALLMFGDILKAVFNFFCGATGTPPPPEKPQAGPQYPQQQQPQQWQHTPHATTPHGHGKPYQARNLSYPDLSSFLH